LQEGRSVIDVDSEEVFLLSKAREHVSFAMSPATGWRWAIQGVQRRSGQPGERIWLETIMIGGRRYTSRQAIARFVAGLSAPTGTPSTVPSGGRAEQIARAQERAAKTFE
jgi:Protein of unknown function (DUF1580)